MGQWRDQLNLGQVIPACPLTLFADGRWSETHQRAVLRYYLDSGAGGVAVGVHTTQFEIRQPAIGLFRPILEMAAATFADTCSNRERFIGIAGVCGRTEQAIREAELAADLGYDAALLSLAALPDASDDELVLHCQRVADTIPIIGFYLQPAVGGRVLNYGFWRELAEIDRLVAIKIAPFDRYATGDVVRAIIDAGRNDIALYTGNDDNIILDLLTPFRFGEQVRFIVGGLLGQWGVWTNNAVQLLDEIKLARDANSIDVDWLSRNASLTDANAAVFDAANGFAGCIPGINEVLRRHGLTPSNRCLYENAILSAGQSDEIDRVMASYPELIDDEFIDTNIDRWFL